MKRIKSKKDEKRQDLIKKIIVVVILLIILGLFLASAFGNLDAFKTLWNSP